MSSEPYSKCDFQNVTPCIESEGPNIWIDVNGDKKPNKQGKDQFMVYVDFYGTVLPAGGQEEGSQKEGECREESSENRRKESSSSCKEARS